MALKNRSTAFQGTNIKVSTYTSYSKGLRQMLLSMIDPEWMHSGDYIMSGMALKTLTKVTGCMPQTGISNLAAEG